jgi:DNA-binding Xre family transcriptional regulator
MRLRIPELLDERELTPYALVKASGGRISMSLAYRLSRERGQFKCLTPVLLAALCDVLRVEPGELLEREPSRAGKKARRKT